MGVISGIVYDDAGAAVDGRVVRLYNRATGALVGETVSGPSLGGVEPTTWNPADKASSSTLSNGNLTSAGNYVGSVRSVFGAASGKWYWEITVDSGPNAMIGIGTSAATITATPNYPGRDAYGWCYHGDGGIKFHSAVSGAYGSSYSTGAVISVLLDMDSGTLEFWRNGVSQGVAYTGISGTIYAMVGGGSSGAADVLTANFGASAFSYAPPSGFAAGFGQQEVAVEDDGGYLFDPVPAGTYTVLFLDDEAGTQHNALVRDRVVVA